MILAKDNGYFRCIFVSDILETKEYLFLTAKQDVYSYLLRVNKEDGSVTSICNGGEFKETPFMKVRYVDVETPKFINDLCGGLPFYPFDQNENSWIAKYEATDLLEQIDIDELKVSSIYVEKGTFMKRYSARAKGRGDRISKQTCHIYVTVGN